MKLNYELDKYSILRSLFWVNSINHFIKAGERQKMKGHLAIAIVEAIPLIGQIASLTEYAIIKLNKKLSKIDLRTDEKHDVKVIKEARIADKHTNKIIHYNKNVERTATLIPTKKDSQLGSGGTGTVLVSREDENRAVKKAVNVSLENEYEIGQVVSQNPLFVQTHNLYIKHYDEYDTIHKLELERVHGRALTGYYQNFDVKLKKQTALNALESLKEGIEFLYDENIAWLDINDGNILVTNEGTIKICDYQYWEKQEDKNVLTKKLLVGSMEITGWVLKSSFLRYQSKKSVANIQFPSSFFDRKINIPSQIISLRTNYDGDWLNNLNINGLKTDKARKEFLIKYIDAVIEELKKMEEPEYQDANEFFTGHPLA